MGHFAQVAGFVNGLRQGLLAEDGLLVLHRKRGDDGVHVVWCGDGDGVNAVAELAEHLAVIVVKLRVRVLLGLHVIGIGASVDVDEGDDVFRGAGVGVAASLAANTDAGNVQLAVEVLAAHDSGRTEGECSSSQSAGFKEVAAVEMQRRKAFRSFH